MTTPKINSLDLSEFTNQATPQAGQGASIPPLSKEQERAMLSSHSAFPSREVKPVTRKVNLNLYVDPEFSELVKSTSKMHRYSYGELFEMALKHLLETKGIQ